MENEQTNQHSDKSNSNGLEIKKLQLFEKVVDQIPGYLKYFDDKRSKHETPITKLTIGSFVSIIAIIIILSGVLVYSKLLDSSAFTFIIGTLLGYLFGISKVVLNRKEE